VIENAWKHAVFATDHTRAPDLALSECAVSRYGRETTTQRPANSDWNSPACGRRKRFRHSPGRRVDIGLRYRGAERDRQTILRVTMMVTSQ
jgi:hypothetical protein